jgi:exonuclease III
MSEMKPEKEETPSLSQSSSFRVLLWNVWLLPWTPNPSLRADAIAQFILDVRPEPDVVILNEAFSQHDKLFGKKMRERFPHVERLGRQYYTIFSSGVWILSRFPIVETQSFHFSWRKGLDFFAAKGVLLTRIRIPKPSIHDSNSPSIDSPSDALNHEEKEQKSEGKNDEKDEEKKEEKKEEFYEVDVYGTHMQAGYKPEMAAARKRHVSEIIQFIKKHSKEDANVIFAGDINMGPPCRDPNEPRSWHYKDDLDASNRTGEYVRMRDSLHLKEFEVRPSPKGNGAYNDINRFLYRGFDKTVDTFVDYIDFEDISDPTNATGKVPLSDSACLECSVRFQS